MFKKKWRLEMVYSCGQQGVIGELRVVGDPRAAERYCEEDGDDSDMVSGGGKD